MAETIESPLLTVCILCLRSILTSRDVQRIGLRQVPFESLKRAAKDKKSSMDEVTSIVKMMEGHDTANMTAAEQLEVLNKMALRLQSLKRKVTDHSQFALYGACFLLQHAICYIINSASSWTRTTKMRKLMHSDVKHESSISRNWVPQPRTK